MTERPISDREEGVNVTERPISDREEGVNVTERPISDREEGEKEHQQKKELYSDRRNSQQ